ncbi:hypothetical protein PIB30_103481, partial [Stylosanthes scabra]|nr:hypothetical protein [Stylosanthes scabra]
KTSKDAHASDGHRSVTVESPHRSGKSGMGSDVGGGGGAMRRRRRRSGGVVVKKLKDLYYDFKRSMMEMIRDIWRCMMQRICPCFHGDMVRKVCDEGCSFNLHLHFHQRYFLKSVFGEYAPWAI